MKKLLTASLLLLFLSITVSSAQKPVYTKYYADKSLVKKAQKWVNAGEWRNGFTAASPDNSVNVVEFYLQYQKNPEQWNAMFKWLANNDLLAISKGKHPIEGTNLVVSVEDDVNGDLATHQSESHFHHIDFQYAVKGVERFGIIDHVTSRYNCAYKPDVVHYSYDVKRAKFYDSDPSKFFLFFPSDWHIAKVNNGQSDQNIRVLVVKIDYKD